MTAARASRSATRRAWRSRASRVRRVGSTDCSLLGTPVSMAQPIRRDCDHERVRSSIACSIESATAYTVERSLALLILT